MKRNSHRTRPDSAQRIAAPSTPAPVRTSSTVGLAEPSAPSSVTLPPRRVARRRRRLLAKATSWTLVFMSVVMAYVTVLGLASVVGEGGAPELPVLIVTTAVIALVLPRLSERVDREVVRLVLGGDVRSYELVNSFVDRVANTLAVDEVLPRLADVAVRTVHGTRAEVRVASSDGDVWRECWPPSSEPRSDGTTMVIDVRHGGEVIGAIEVEVEERFDRRDLEALDELVGPAGLALSTVRLTFDLRRRARQVQQVNDELRASRQRIIDARRVERDRLLEDVDRLVQPHLDAVLRHLDEAARGLSRSGSDLTVTLTEARVEAVQALESLRKLARGVSSPILFEAGAIAALEAWGIQATPAVVVRVAGDLDVLRAHARVGATLYSVCVTAAEATPRSGPIVVKVDIDSDAVRIHVPMSGRVAPSVMQLLIDRTAAIDGSIEMREDSSSGRSSLIGRLPIVRLET